jgi:cysteine sulfinate desulfinase/cysteine desulfurase-like protein
MHDEQRAHSSVRISVGRSNSEKQMDEAAQRIVDAADSLRAFTL